MLTLVMMMVVNLMGEDADNIDGRADCATGADDADDAGQTACWRHAPNRLGDGWLAKEVAHDRECSGLAPAAAAACGRLVT